MPTIAKPQPHLRRAIEPDGTVHAARYAGDRTHFATACAVYPAPECAALEGTADREVTCLGCRRALCPGVAEYGHGLTLRVIHRGCCPES